MRTENAFGQLSQRFSLLAAIPLVPERVTVIVMAAITTRLSTVSKKSLRQATERSFPPSHQNNIP